MKKFVAAICILFLAVVVCIPEKMPRSLQTGVHKTKAFFMHAKNSLFSTTKEPTDIYVSQKNGKIVYTDTQSHNATKHEDKSISNFIDMQSNQQQTQSTEKSLEAVTDPITSINKEAQRNVEKMQQEKNKQLEKKLGI